MKKALMIFLLSFLSGSYLMAQVKIGDNPATISPGSLVELESTSKAFTLPRMTTVQMQAIPSPLKGMMIFNIDSNCIYLYRANSLWSAIRMDVAPAAPIWPYRSNDNTIGTPGNHAGIVSITGAGLLASGEYSHAEGYNSAALGSYSLSLGISDTAAGGASTAIGSQNKALGTYSLAIGFQNIAAYQSAVALGQENADSGWASMAMGIRNKIFNLVSYSNALGFENQITGGTSHTLFGESNFINGGRANGGFGYANTITTGNYNNAFGTINNILAGRSHITGGEGNIIKSGVANSIFGTGNTGDGSYLGAIGKDNAVFYQSSVALGQSNKDSGWASVAGGLNNTIESDIQYGNVFGNNNLLTRNLSLPNAGKGSFSAGINNINSGYASIALGASNKPSSQFGLAANYNTLSNSFGMSAFGHFNDTTNAFQGTSYEPSEMLFSIGNGFNNTNRRNSFTMMRNGFTTINTTTENGANLPRAELDIKGTGALIVPVGTTAQRPDTPVTGMIRFCTDCPGGPVLQGYDGTSWVNL